LESANVAVDGLPVDGVPSFAGGTPQDLMALTLADVWQLETAGRAINFSRSPSKTSIAVSASPRHLVISPTSGA